MNKVTSFLASRYGLWMLSGWVWCLAFPPVGAQFSERVPDGLQIWLQANSRSLQGRSNISIPLSNRACVGTSTSGLVALDTSVLLINDNRRLTHILAPARIRRSGGYLRHCARVGRTWSIRCAASASLPDRATLTFEVDLALPPSFAQGRVLLCVAADSNFTRGVQLYPLRLYRGAYQATDVPIGEGVFVTLVGAPLASLWAMGSHPDNRITAFTPTDKRVDTLWNQIGPYNHLVGAEVGGGEAGADYPEYIDAPALTAGMNGWPYVRLNHTDLENYLRVPRYDGFGGPRASVFGVVRRDRANDPQGEVLFSYTRPNRAGAIHEWSVFDPIDVQTILKNSRLVLSTQHRVTHGRPALLTATVELDTDGAQVGCNGRTVDRRLAPTLEGRTLLRHGQLVLGQGAGFKSSDAWEGDWAEVVVVDGATTPLERAYIETYLAFKYGITPVGRAYLVDRTTPVWDPEGSSRGYSHAVTAVGVDSNFLWRQLRARNQSDAGACLTLSGAVIHAASAVLVVGDNGEQLDSLTAMGAPQGDRTLGRVWYVRNPQHGVERVQLTFDGLPEIPGLCLLVSSSPPSANTPKRVYQGVESGGDLVFQNVCLSDGAYFCLGRVQQ